MKYKIVVCRKLVFYYWKIVSTANGKTLGTSETYSSKAKTLQTASLLSRVFKIKLEVE